MRKVKIEHTISCTPEAFWKVFFDRAFNDALYREGLEFKAFELVEQRDDGRHLRATPKMNMPKPVMKVLGDSFGYEEHGAFDGSSYKWRITPNKLADKLRNEGTLRCVASGDDKCRACDEMIIEAKVFALGKLIESSAEKEFRDAWEKISAFMNLWIAEHDLS